jgi:Fe-S oxidoreductase
MLDTARGWLRALVEVLDPWTSRGIPVVVPEPSCLAAFRDELPNLLPDDPRAARLASLARSPAERLLELPALEALPRAAADGSPGGTRVVIHPHCHARASRAAGADARLLTTLGYAVEVLDAGCCGLAGGFGYRAEHEALSRRIGEEQWLPRVQAAVGPDATLVIDGFSCASQLQQLADLPAERLMTLVRRRLAADPRLAAALPMAAGSEDPSTPA